MRTLSFDRLTTRLVVAVGIGLLLFSTVAGIFTYQSSYRRELALAESLQQQLVQTLREQAEVAVYAANARIAQGVLDGLVGSPFILAATIRSPDGFRVAAGSPAARAPGARKSYPLYSPVDPREPIGVLEVLQDDAYVHDQAARTATYQTALMLAQVLIAVLILAAVLRILIVAPITRLARAMGAIRPGSPARLATDDPHARDEIGLLTASANGLLDASAAALNEERALRAMLETMGNIARVGGWRFDPDSRRLTWGDEIYRIFERDPAAPVSPREAMSHFAEADRKAIIQAFLEAIHRARSFDLELPAQTVAGRPIWVRIQGQYEAVAGRRLLSGALQDITERKRGEAELVAAKQAAEAANLAKSRFLAAASHDLRQPIQAINLFQSALATTALDPEQKHISASLATATRSLGDLLNALLDISQLDSGAVAACVEPLHIDALLCRLEGEFAPLAAAKSLRFRLHLPSRDLVVRTDPKLLQSLLGNLVGNAVKYTRRGGILVGVRRRRGRALVQVWDTGIGIAPEHIDRIFEEYFQVGNPERNRAKGLGLGLSIARRLARLLGTDLACRSRPGRGSVFEFGLPLADPPAEGATAAGPVVAPGASGRGRHVIVVEDDEMVAKALVLSLQALGMSVATYGSAEAALADPGIQGAYAYICDYRLPGIDGGRFLDVLQRAARGPIRAVMLTGDATPGQIDPLLSAGWRVLYKPIDLASLVAAMDDESAQ